MEHSRGLLAWVKDVFGEWLIDNISRLEFLEQDELSPKVILEVFLCLNV